MEDKRILKTRRNLKATLVRLLATLPFEKITVSELCRAGETSRITFYTYYEDKYALIEEMFDDYVREAVADYRRLQLENNPAHTALGGYDNMLECILNLYYNNLNFFAAVAPEKNPYLYSLFFRTVLSSVNSYVEDHRVQMPPKYSSRQTAALLCNGLWGVINECYHSASSPEEMRRSVKDMYHDILVSPVFRHA